jgi:hypothetical protein
MNNLRMNQQVAEEVAGGLAWVLLRNACQWLVERLEQKVNGEFNNKQNWAFNCSEKVNVFE